MNFNTLKGDSLEILRSGHYVWQGEGGSREKVVGP